MTAARPTALVADDEPLLRTALVRMLADAWPGLDVVAMARNGREALERFEALQPDVCFLDVRMPGMDGIAAARGIGRRAQVVFVTAFDRYAVQAFEQGALDYLVKPVEPARLADTVARLRQPLEAARPLADVDALLDQLAARLQPAAKGSPLRWLRVSVGNALRMIAVEDIDYLRSDEKYTRVAWRDEAGKPAEALVRTPLKDLLAQLDATLFAQVHRSAVVNLRAVSHVTRGDNETAHVHLKGRAEVLPVSRTYAAQFRPA
jgi:DNA-binding LytR/AlgR family response regulator